MDLAHNIHGYVNNTVLYCLHSSIPIKINIHGIEKQKILRVITFIEIPDIGYPANLNELIVFYFGINYMILMCNTCETIDFKFKQVVASYKPNGQVVEKLFKCNKRAEGLSYSQISFDGHVDDSDCCKQEIADITCAYSSSWINKDIVNNISFGISSFGMYDQTNMEPYIYLNFTDDICYSETINGLFMELFSEYTFQSISKHSDIRYHLNFETPVDIIKMYLDMFDNVFPGVFCTEFSKYNKYMDRDINIMI